MVVANARLEDAAGLLCECMMGKNDYGRGICERSWSSGVNPYWRKRYLGARRYY